MEAELKREMANKVKAYESKLAMMTVIQQAVQKENEQLRAELKEAQTLGIAEEEMLELKEEFTRRLGTADQTISRLQDDKDRLKAQLSANDASQGLQQLQEQVAKEQRRYAQASKAAGEQIDSLSSQLAEAVADAQCQVDQVRQDGAEAVRKVEDAAARGGAEAVASSVERETAMSRHLADLQSELEASEAKWAEKEITLRREVLRLELQNHHLEADKADQTAGATEATRPLLRQIQVLTAQAAQQQRTAQDSELCMLRQLRQAESTQAATSQALSQACSKAEQAEAAAAAAKQRLVQEQGGAQKLNQELRAEQQKCQALQAQCLEAEAELQSATKALQEAQRTSEKDCLLLQSQVQALQQQLSELQSSSHAIPGQASLVSQPHPSLPAAVPPSGPPSQPRGIKAAMLKLLNGSQAFSIQPAGHAYTNHNHKPQPSQDAAQPSQLASAQARPAQDSLSHSAGPSLLPVSTSSFVVGHGQDTGDTPTHRQTQGGIAQQDEYLQQPQSSNGDAASGAVSTSQVEAEEPVLDDLDSLLRNKPGVGKQPSAADSQRQAALQRRLQSSDTAERRMRNELLKACERAESAERDAAEAWQLKEHIKDWEHRYDMALELIGERNERVDQLTEDIAEMKLIFHQQLSMMADNLTALSGQSGESNIKS